VRRARYFHYKSEPYAKRTLDKLRNKFPNNKFELRLREDFRHYIWATLPNGTGGWVQKVKHSHIGASL
jgi:hypothetical protein